MPTTGNVFTCGQLQSDVVIFTPCPPATARGSREVHTTLTNDALGRINIEASGEPDDPRSDDLRQRQQWVSLDGITFRCAPSGQNGCP